MDTWPKFCDVCDAPWRVKSRTMGARHGQPHVGVCENGHTWREPFETSKLPEHPATVAVTTGGAVCVRVGDDRYQWTAARYGLGVSYVTDDADLTLECVAFDNGTTYGIRLVDQHGTIRAAATTG